jgi:hypothetical protein
MFNYYHRFVPQAAAILSPLNALIASTKKATSDLTWTQDTERSFAQAKEALARATLLHHPRAEAKLAIVTDASDTAVGAALQQRTKGIWQPLGFFSRKLTPPQIKYGAFDRGLLAIYQATSYFRHQLEGRNFTIYTDHKPIIGALKSTSDKYTGRQFRHLDYITQMTTDVRHVKGIDNIVADCLSRIQVDSIEPFSLTKIAVAQENDEELKHLMSSTDLKKIEIKEGTEGTHSSSRYSQIPRETIRSTRTAKTSFRCLAQSLASRNQSHTENNHGKIRLAKH